MQASRLSFNSRNNFGIHCPSCRCQASQEFLQKETNDFLQWRKNQPTSHRGIEPMTSFMESRVMKINDPVALEVGPDPSGNRTIWFKSVSPKPVRITMKISSPDRPSLRPSFSTSSLHRKNHSQLPTNTTLETSRLHQGGQNQESINFTPYKALETQNNITFCKQKSTRIQDRFSMPNQTFKSLSYIKE